MGKKRTRAADSVYAFRVTGRVERLDQAQLDRFPGSILHTAIESGHDGDSGTVDISLPDNSPQKRLAPMVFALFRGASFGEAVLQAVRICPPAFERGLSLADIAQSLDYMQLPQDILCSGLQSLVDTISSIDGDPKWDFVNSPGLVTGLLRLHMLACARNTAYTVLSFLRQGPEYALFHGSLYFVIKMRYPRAGPGRRKFLPLCYPLEPDWYILQGEGEGGEALIAAQNMKSFLESVGRAKQHGMEAPPIMCKFDRTLQMDGDEDDYDDIEHPTVGPSSFPSFCSALQQELNGMGLRSAWHEGRVCMRPRYMDYDASTPPDESDREFMSVSWV